MVKVKIRSLRKSFIVLLSMFVLTSCTITVTPMQQNNAQQETIVFLHGILRSKLDMYPLKKYFESKGYKTINIQYPSRKMDLGNLSTFVHERIINDPQYNDKSVLNFVTHSMGGLITRYYIDTYKPKNLGKVVMLGPPNTGSEFADWLSDVKILAPLYKSIYGPAGRQLRTDYVHHDKITYPLGVIAGNACIMPLAPWVLIDGEHDGIVPVNRTKIDGMTDHIVIYSTHTLMMFNHNVMDQAYYFLRNGKFNHSSK